MKPFLTDILGGRKKKNKTMPKIDPPESPRRESQAVELGTIDYINLTPDGKHGDYNAAVQTALETGKPMFANFVEWSGGSGCKDAGAIFADPTIKRAAEELFVPCAFNTWDRGSAARNQAMRQWGAGLKGSGWGYLRIVDVSGGKNKSLVISGTRQITGRHQLEEVRQVMVEALEDVGRDVPASLQ